MPRDTGTRSLSVAGKRAARTLGSIRAFSTLERHHRHLISVRSLDTIWPTLLRIDFQLATALYPTLPGLSMSKRGFFSGIRNRSPRPLAPTVSVDTSESGLGARRRWSRGREASAKDPCLVELSLR